MAKDNSQMRLTRKLTWRLPVLMAEHRIRSATELKRRLEEIGYEITSVHVARLVHHRPQRISSDLLDALVTIFDCTANDILTVEKISPEDNDSGKTDEPKSRQVPRLVEKVSTKEKKEKKKPKTTRAILPEGIPLENFAGPKLHALPNPYKKEK